MDAPARLAVATRGNGWWEDYDVTPPRSGLYLGLEQVAESLVSSDPDRVHALLQTPGYMRALYLAERGPQLASLDEGQVGTDRS